MGYGKISLGVSDFLKGKRRRRDTRRDRSKDAKDRREVGGGTRETLPEKRAFYTIFPSSRSAAIPDLPVLRPSVQVLSGTTMGGGRGAMPDNRRARAFFPLSLCAHTHKELVGLYMYVYTLGPRLRSGERTNLPECGLWMRGNTT